MDEFWLPISRYPAYEVSDQGRIRRALPGKGAVVGRILSTPVDGEGYPHVNFTGQSERVHVLVAETFLGPIPRRGQVHHRNEVKTDCRSENLEVTRGRRAHAFRHRKPDSTYRAYGEPNRLISCACRCGEKLRKYDSYGRPRRFLYGHNLRLKAAA